MSVTKHKAMSRVGSLTYQEDQGCSTSAQMCSRPQDVDTKNEWWWPVCEQGRGSQGHSHPRQPVSFCMSPWCLFSQMRCPCFSQSRTISPETLNQGSKASLARITKQWETDTRLPRSYASPDSLMLFFFSHCPAKKIKEDIFKWLPSRA